MRGLNDDPRRATPGPPPAIIAGAGFLAPWMTGAGVKLYLDAHGQPTYPWLDFLHPGRLVLALIGTAVWAAPFLALALGARWLRRSPTPAWLTAGDRRVLVAGGLLLGLWGEVRVFTEVFWQWDPIALFAGVLLAGQYAPYVVAGVAAGAVTVAARHAGRFLLRRTSADVRGA